MEGKTQATKGQAQWVRVRTLSACESTPPALVAPAVGGGAGPASLWLRLFDAPLATCLQSEEQSGKGRREAMCVRDSTRRSIGWWDCYHGEADRKGRGGPSVKDLEPYWLCGTALGAVLEAYWSLREGAGKAARGGRSSSPLCRPFPWAFSWLSVSRLEAVVTTDWRHDNDPNPSPELGPHHGLPLRLSTSPIHPSHPTSLPPPWLLSTVLVPSPLPGTLEHLGVMDGRRNGGTHGMVAWEGTVPLTVVGWGSGIKVPRAAVVMWIFKKPMQLGSREKVVS